MAAAIKTPGVYIVEKNAFPNSVVEVATAVPAFIGYTEIIPPEGVNVPKRLSSLAEYLKYFGGAPKTQLTFKKDLKLKDPANFAAKKETQSLLYYSMRLFFDNGGGPCWVISAGDYAKSKSAEDIINALGPLEKNLEPTMLVAPDAILLEPADWQKVCQQFLGHCGKMQNRVSLLDVFHGDQKRTFDAASDPIMQFRNAITSDFLNYGQAYYPWVRTSIVDELDVDYSVIKDSLTDLTAVLTAAVEDSYKDAPDKDAADRAKKAILDIIGKMKDAKTDAELRAEASKAAAESKGDNAGNKNPPAAPVQSLEQIHRSLRAVSATYVAIMQEAQRRLNLLPPSGGMAGVYTRVDNSIGVFKAPANTGMNSVIEPAVDMTNAEQEDLNVPLDGKAINAIRAFPARGVLIWGARTLDGNSQDWRYINVRRTIIMLEQSIKFACLAYVFEANSASTWVTVKNMITNFLTNQWKAGALVGAKPEEAFSVDVGLGSTMTADDVLNGFMNVTIKVALVRPAEFIVLTFQQKMQTS